jgi:hypothetical protein
MRPVLRSETLPPSYTDSLEILHFIVAILAKKRNDVHYNREFAEANLLDLHAQSTDQTLVIKAPMNSKRNMWWGWTLHETLFFASATQRNKGSTNVL